MERMYRHYRVNRMASKARRIVRELFDAAVGRAAVPADRMARAGGPPRQRRHGAGRRRLHRRHDRPLRPRRALPPVRPLRDDVMNLFAHFRDVIIAEIEALMQRGRAAGGARAGPRRGRAAARSGAWRSLDQCRDGAGEGGGHDAARRWRKCCASASRCSATWSRPRWPGRASSICASPMRSGMRGSPRCCAPAPPMAIRTMGGGRTVNVEYRLGQSDRADACRPRARRGGRRRARRAARQGRVRGVPRILHQRRRRAGRCARALAPLRYREALGEGGGEMPEGLYPGDYLKETAAALVARDGDRWLAAEERSGCRRCAISPLPR